ncbi:MAG: DUF2795 domain-containing protein [Chloroflexi bacterium]|nr:DUF2795 domain-containing protein [Chloroflexota bacterium]
MTQEGGAFPGSAAQVAQYLEGIDFPKGKQDLLRHAEQRGAPAEIRNVLGRMEDRQYYNMADVMKAFGDLK